MSLTTRRDFLKLGGSAAAFSSLGFPQTPASGADTARKVGYCIVGLGRISMNQFMPGVQISQRSRLVALVSGHRDKAEKMAAHYAIPTAHIYDYQHYEAIADNREIDAVYIALPNSMHAEYTIRAAQAGKHVLCEKPMANTVAECEQMIAACHKAGRKLMIAYRCQYEPTNLRAIRMIRDGSIGRLELIESSLGFNIRPGEWRLSKKMAGGGPLVDVGIYSLQACRYLTGEEPTELSASWSVNDQDGRFTEVEENLVWSMRFPSGVLANCMTSYGSNLPNGFRALGSKGWVQLEPAFSYEGLRMRFRGPDGAIKEEPADDPAPRQFMREADHLAECILENKEPKTPGEEGLRDQKLMAAIYQACTEDRRLKVPSTFLPHFLSPRPSLGNPFSE